LIAAGLLFAAAPVGASSPAQAFICTPPGSPIDTAWQLDSSPNLNAMRNAILASFAHVEVRMAGVTGDVVGFRAGADYEYIYARDSATMATTVQYFYDLAYLTRSVEEFLELQYDGEAGDPHDLLWTRPAQPGAISGVLGNSPFASKMLVTSDEETSLIHMAFVAYRSGAGATWLNGIQAGRTRIDRLNMAMEWLYRQRYEPSMGMIKRGHTTDWGDVEFGQGHSSVASTPEPRDWTASIFDQGWTHRALLELAEMNDAVERADLAALSRQRAQGLRHASTLHLWQPDRGHYRTHVHIPPVKHDFDEDGMVSIANAIAVYTGLGDANQRDSIYKVLETARVAAKARKPGLTLWPAYPAGFFDYPQMQPGRYQNGAVWDWWGATQISGQFWNGYSAMGRAHLEMVAADWARTPGNVFEWQDTNTGINAGSGYYAGAAAHMTEAIIEGLFGAQIHAGGFHISPRLGAQSGSLSLMHPGTGCWINYTHKYLGDRIVLDLDAGHVTPGQLRLLIPERVRPGEVRLNGRLHPARIERLGEDVYVALSGQIAPGTHTLEVKLLPPPLFTP
jgi:hypothetical protein